MPPLALALAGLLGLGLSATPSLELGLKVEGRYRGLEVPGQAPERFPEAELAPWLLVGLETPGMLLTADYRPLLTLTDRGGEPSALLHRASLAGRWQQDEGWATTLTLDGRTGTVSMLQLLPDGGGGGMLAQPVPSVAAIGYRSALARLELDGDLGPRQRLEASLEVALEGGLSAEDQRTLPFQHRGLALLAHTWDASQHDELTTGLELTAAEFSTGISVGIATLGEVWQRQLSPTLALRGGAGAALAAQLAPGGTDPALQPSALLGAQYDGLTVGRPLQADLELRLGPYIDRLTAAVPQRIAFEVTLVFAPGGAWRLEGSASGGRVIEGPQLGDQVWGGSLQLGRTLGERAEVALGVRGLVQRQPRLFAQSADWNAYLSVALHTRRRPAPPKESAAPEVDPVRPR